MRQPPSRIRLDTLAVNLLLKLKSELKQVMKSRLLLLPVAAALAASLPAQAQTAPKPSAPAAKPAPAAAPAGAVKLPPGIPPARGIVKTTLALKYQDIKIGTGPLGEEKQVWSVKYTGWRAADGVKFDSWDQHPQPVLENGKPKVGADGKPVLGDPQPMEFPHGVGRMIPGFDLAVEGMHVGGKRRLFIPWALAYGYRAIPDRGADHPGIPAKSDLIFDVELVGVKELPPPPPAPAPRPMPQPGAPGTAPGIGPGSPGTVPRTAPGTAPGLVLKPGQPAQPGTPAQPSAPAAPAPAPAPAPAQTPTPQPKPATPPGN